MAKKESYETVEAQNASVLADLVVDPMTPEATRVQILNKLLDSKSDANFFDTLIEERLDFAECPNCQHTNFWLTPEIELNKRGIATADRDSRVENHTTAETCPELQEACQKKKVMM